MKKRISIVIPVFNGKDFIFDAVNSVLNQSRPADEIIVVDDGSTDGTSEIVAGFGTSVSVVRLPNQGVGAARNAGIQAARGDWVALLDADDVWHPQKLTVFEKAFTDYPEAVLFFSDARVIDSGGQSLRLLSGDPKGPARWDRLLLRNWVITSSAVVKRPAAMAAGLFRTDFQCRAGVEDWDFFLRLMREGSSHYVPGAWTLYRHHPTSAIQSQRRLLREDGLRVVDLNSSGISPDLRRLAVGRVYYDSGVRFLGLLDLNSAREEFRNAFRFMPGDLSLWGMWVITHLGGRFIQILIKCKRRFFQWGTQTRQRCLDGGLK
jgi:glycosyltransferase involved in cell wall biosynthesis